MQKSGYKRYGLVLMFFFMIMLSSCGEKVTTPKPRGFYRIEIPKVDYVEFTSEELPFTFDISQFVTVELPPLEVSENWMNLAYESLDAKVYCNFYEIKKDELGTLDAESRELVSRNAKRADVINERKYENFELNVYGTLFIVKGETPSPIQFMLTDSSKHFFRGALYYQCILDPDSLTPVTEYLQDDIIRLIQSFRWK